MGIPPKKPPKASPVFEQINLERMKKAAQTVSRAEAAMRQSEALLEKSHELAEVKKKTDG